jgi:hypothetical protein
VEFDRTDLGLPVSWFAVQTDGHVVNGPAIQSLRE